MFINEQYNAEMADEFMSEVIAHIPTPPRHQHMGDTWIMDHARAYCAY